MNRNLLIGAVALLVALGAAYYYIDIRGREAAGEEEAAALLLVAPFDPAGARDVIIEPFSGPAVRLQRDGADTAWTVGERPGEYDADPDAVRRLFETLERLSMTGDAFAPGDDGLTAYGLAPPRLQVAVSGEGGVELARLALGDAAPLGDARYALVRHTGQVGLVPAAAADIPRTVFDLRDRRLVRFQRDDVREVRITAAGVPELVILREGDDWRIDEPIDFVADRELVGDLLWELAECRAQAFPEGAGAVSGAAGSLRLVMGDGLDALVQFDAMGDSETSLLAVGPGGAVMAVDAAILETLRRPAREWRQLRPFPRYAWEIERITVGAGTAEPVCWRRGEDGAWQGAGPAEPAAAPEEAIRRAIERLTALEACAIIEAGDAAAGSLGPDLPAFAVSLGGGPEDTGPGERLELCFPDGAPAALADDCEGTETLVAGVRPASGVIYLIDDGSRDELRDLLQRLSTVQPLAEAGSGGE